MGIVWVEGQITRLGICLRNRHTVRVLTMAPLFRPRTYFSIPTVGRFNQRLLSAKRSPQFEGTFCASKAAPDGSRVVKKSLCVITILRRQIPEPLPGTGKKQFAFQRRSGLVCLHQFVYLEGAGITGRLLLLDVTVK